ncbi:MAG: aldehyde dehydrogenase [Rhodospirillales bacterium]|nr:aldehyde dehydrogenase [Rhodospirillales bacterium]
MKDIPTQNMFIGNEWVPAASGKTLDVENPANGGIIARVPEAGVEDVEKAVAAAEEGFREWGGLSGVERAVILSRAAAVLGERLNDFVETEVKQCGRPIREMSAQLGRQPEWFEYFAALARTYENTQHPFGTGHVNYTRRVPLGVVAQLTPWNHPLHILMKKVAPALAAGNAIVAKPSELAPLTPLMLGEVLKDAGLPAGAFNVITGFGGTAGKALVTHPRIRKIDLTGGTETGRRIAAIAADSMIPCTAELGGKAAVIIFDDVDFERAVSGAMFAAFIAAGQTCVQGSRILVQRSIHDRFVERYTERVGAIRLGDPEDPKTQMGPVVSKAQRDNALNYIASAIEEGATIATGGKPPEGKAFENGYYLEPTVITEVTSGMRVFQEEIFGPVTVVVPFEDEADAIRLANATEFGLGSSVWSRESSRGHRVAHALDCGVVWINDHHRIDPASPWGGHKSSGMGHDNGILSYESYTKYQSVIVNLSDDFFDWYGSDEAGRLN